MSSQDKGSTETTEPPHQDWQEFVRVFKMVGEKHPFVADRLGHFLDVIDNKAAGLLTYIGILLGISSITAFLQGDSALGSTFTLVQIVFTAVMFASIFCAAILCLSCFYLSTPEHRPTMTADDALNTLARMASVRRRRFNWALRFAGLSSLAFGGLMGIQLVGQILGWLG